MPAEIHKDGQVIQWLIEGDRITDHEFGYPLSIVGTPEGVSVKVGGVFRDLKPVYINGQDNPPPIRLDSGYEIHVVFEHNHKRSSKHQFQPSSRMWQSYDPEPRSGVRWI